MEKLRSIMQDTHELEKFFTELGDFLEIQSLEDYITSIVEVGN